MESSNSIEVDQLQEKENSTNFTKTTITLLNTSFIDSALYKAAAKGEIEPFNACSERLDHLLTPTKNTIFHIHITHSTPSISFMKQCLAKCSSLLLQTNNRGETPLHIAARHGHDLTIVKFLIDSAKDQHREDIETGVEAARAMLRMENIQQETALHEAARLGWSGTVQVLISEDPDYTYSSNKDGETPLYLAVERGYREIALQILNTCTSPAYHGPNGRTALHEAAIINDSVMTAKIIEKKKNLVKEVDQQGSSPLHYASYYGCLSIVKQLLECDKTVAYIGDKNGKTALHIAAGMISKEVVSCILEHCPDCHELVDVNGRNVLHFAMLGRNSVLLNHMFRLKNIIDADYFPSLANLFNRKDVDGNTPLHLAATYCVDCYNLIENPLIDKMAVNNKNSSPLDIILANSNEHSDGDKGGTISSLTKGGYMTSQRNFIETKVSMPTAVDMEYLERLKNAHMVVAALIVTVTFAAGFTMPGGYDGEEGSAILSKSSAFKTFVVTDAIALLLSTCALLFHYIWGFGGLNKRRLEHFVDAASVFIMLAIILMLIAFASGIYAVLPHSSNLGAAVCVITSFFVLICYYPLKIFFVKVYTQAM